MRSLWLSLGCFALLACGAPAPLPPSDCPPPPGATLPNFALLDVNPASATSGRNVSPLDYRGRVSAWYFGHSS